MPRFFLSPDAWAEESLLQGDEARHLGQVMRAGPGERVEVFDGCGRSADAEVLEVAKKAVRLRLGEERRADEPRPRVALAQAIPKGKTMDLIVQKAVELGVAEIQPLVTSHTVVRPDARKAEKWQRVALEACKQCGQNVLPQVREPAEFGAWLTARDAAVPGLMASLADGARGFREVLGGFSETPAALEMLIGPEGDFSAGETAAALEAGFRPVTLGEIVLRVETAALYCVGALRFWWGE